MKLNWKIAESTVLPNEVDCLSSPNCVYLRKNIVLNDGMYSYQEVELSNEYRYDILDTQEYLDKLLEIFKVRAKLENQTALAQKETISTSVGEFSIKTPTYDFIFCLMALKELPTGIPAGKIRFAGGSHAPAMTQVELQSLYFEFSNAVAELDAKFIGYKSQIENASTIDALEQIEFDY